ncbi:unnamed protein product [Rotaria sp. Silwood2]|nr:unnamed protein product [Rotaria sp. Silwood2]
MLTDAQRKKHADVACAVFKLESVPSAAAILKESLPYEYLTFGKHMRGNIEYELQEAKKQKRMEYRPIYDPTTFKLTAVARTKENGCGFALLKTSLHTSMHNRMLSSATTNDLSSYSYNNTKHLKFVHTTSMNNLQMCSEAIATPIGFNKNKFSTSVSIQRRRASGLINHNSNQISRVLSSDDFSEINHNEPIITSEISYSHSEGDLSHNIHTYQDAFDNLIPTDERIEHMLKNRFNGMNILSYLGMLLYL